jgi:hypothetical protein
MLGMPGPDLSEVRVRPHKKIGRRTGHSQKIVPGLEAFNHVRNAKPGPERSEGPPSPKDRARTGRMACGDAYSGDPKRSEGPPSPKDRARTGRMACGDAYSGDPKRSEGPASSIGPMCKREPERSEGSGGKAPRAFQLLLVLT